MKSEEINKKLLQLYSYFFGGLGQSYDPSKDNIQQCIFKRNEIPEADFLLGFKEKLTKEFLKDFSSLKEAAEFQARNVMQKKADRVSYLGNTPDPDNNRFPDEISEMVRKNIDDDHSIANPDGWKNVEIKYHDPFNNVKWDIDVDYAKSLYPVAWNLVQHFGDDCPIASYSVLAPNTVIHRHTGPENRHGEYVRIHIPLIVPDGDLFIEVNGEEIRWDDIFAFDNQYVHSAHNYSDEYRLIFLIDIKRSRLNLPPGQHWNKDRQLFEMKTVFKRKQY